MLCNPDSFFPDEIDRQLFFQDITIDNIDEMNHFQSLLNQGKYTDASEYVNQLSGIYGTFACFLNAYENRVYKLQHHLSKQTKTNPHFFNEGYIVPHAINVGEYWLSAGEPIDKFVFDPEANTIIDKEKILKIQDETCNVDTNTKTLVLNCSNNEYIAVQQYN